MPVPLARRVASVQFQGGQSDGLGKTQNAERKMVNAKASAASSENG